MAKCLQVGEYYGDIVRQARFGSVLLTETLHPAGTRVPRHSHALGSVCYVISGSFSESSDLGMHECSRTDLICRPAGQEHTNIFSEKGGRCFGVEFENDSIDEPAVISKLQLTRLIKQLYSEVLRPDSCSGIAVEGLCLLMQAAIRRQCESPSASLPAWLALAREMIREEYRRNPTLSQIAEVVGVHPAHLSREFKRHYGRSVGDYTRSCKLGFARQLLKDRSRSLGDIAMECGFYDQAHFSRRFRDEFGVTPLEFRRQQ